MKTITLIGTHIARSRERTDEQHCRDDLIDKFFDKLFVDAMESVLDLAPEVKGKEEYQRYCPDKEIMGFEQGGLVRGLLLLMSIKRKDDFPGLETVLRKLGIPTNAGNFASSETTLENRKWNRE